jgi:aspartyl-tRNA(Asn)/glutamyl-tRNA(Gln) amidotransferase subunit A
MPILKQALAIYYTLMPAEATTNLARFDGIRFGLQKNTFDFDSITDYYADIRSD